MLRRSTCAARALRRGSRSALVAFLAVSIGSIAWGQHHVPGSDAEHPRVQYADSLVSLNDRCIVRQNKLNTRIPPVYVNGKPIGFC